MVSSEAFKKRISRSKGATKLKVFSRERAVSISLTRIARQKKAGSERSTGVSIPAVYSLPVIGSRVTWVHRAFSALSIFALVGPLLVPVAASAVQGSPPSISITSITDSEGVHNAPFDFNCQTNPLFNPVSVSGNGTGSAPPGDANQYRVQVDWGDSTVTNGLGTFTPNSGHVNFSFVFTSPTHTYTTNGNFTIKARLYHSQPPGHDNQADAIISIPICVHVPPPTHGSITMTKVVSGGTAQVSDFTLMVGSTAVTSGAVNDFAAGTYIVSETGGPTGYTGTISGDCDSSTGSVTIAPGAHYDCTITNTFTGEPPPPPPSPQCSDDTDNDGDGKTDFPADPGCLNAEDEDETDSPPPPPSPQCSDGTDNDSDGKIDYPNDPGLADASDNDESDDPPPPPPDPEDDLTECSNELDDDDDGSIDLDDSGCAEFAPKITVMKILTNDNTGTAELSAFSFFVDLIEVFLGTPTVFGPGSHAVSETGPGGYTASFSGDCAPDGIVSLDIGESATCTVTNDDIDYPQCSDGVDNDGDGDIDGVDSGCANAEDNDENTPPVITIDTELVELTLHSSFDSLSGVTVTDVEDDPDPSVVVGGDTVNTSATGTYVVVYDAVDSDGAAAEQKTRTVNVVSPECSDGTDNDQDGKTDYPADPGCSSASDDDETNAPPPPPPSPQCSDGIDNDQDGLIDMVDPGCTDSSDNDETNTTGGGDSGGGGGSSESSGSGGGGNGPILSLPGDNTSGGGGGGIVLPSGLVLGAAAEDNLPEGCSAYLDIYIKRGASNDPEKVKKLQSFLNREMGANIPITGFYGPLSYIWVEKFQVKYWEEDLKQRV